MAKPSQANEQTMEEILASIRRMMADDRPAGEPLRPAAPVTPPVPASPAFAANVSRLFAGDEPEDDAGEGTPAEGPASATVIELAITQGIDEAEAEFRREIAPAATEVPVAPAAARPQPARVAPPPRAEMPRAAVAPAPVVAAAPAPMAAAEPDGAAIRPAPPLLSHQSGAAVAGAFDDLARAMFAGGNRTVDGLVEDLLRPMLRDWLDDNLPPLVERMVREEIERVSRGRR